nr:hypothetical protein CFP56_32724 [Quercus suber]
MPMRLSPVSVPIFKKSIMMEKNDTWKESGVYPRDAAMVMLSGRVADGFTTILVGELGLYHNSSSLIGLTLFRFTGWQ